MNSIWTKTIAGMVGVAFAATAAQGAAPRYTKKESDIAATQTAVTKPTQKVKEEKKRPDLSAEDIFGGVGEKIKLMTDSQIKVLQRLIQNTADTDPDKPDYLFRMAELYAENQRYYNFRARELDEKIFNLGNEGKKDEAAKMRAQQVDYQKREQQWLLAAVKQYLEVADHPEKYSAYKKMDEVLFYLAYLLTQVKKEEAARKYFKRLIKDYPSSKFIPDAYFSFGEYFFDSKDLESALKFYDKVLEFPQSRVFGYAKYKEGWCYYNLGDFKQALGVFIDVINMVEKGQGSNNKANRIALQKEARKDVVRAYAQIGTPDKAWPLFQRVGGDFAPNMLEALGELYNSQGKFADSIKIYRELMKISPTSLKLCYWQAEIMRNTLSMTGSNAHPDTVKELQRLSAVYDKLKDTKGVKEETLTECRDTTANTLRELATVWHKTAQKTGNGWELPQYLYKEYLKAFPKEKDVYTMSFYYAELLFTIGTKVGDKQKFCEAAPVYSDVVKQNTDIKAKYLKEAAYAAVISWKNCLDVEDSADDAARAQEAMRAQRRAAQGNKKDKKEVKEEKPLAELYPKKEIPDRWKQMITAFDTYIKYVPDSKELVTIKYRKARVYYEYNHFEEAMPAFAEIADKHQDSELAIYSANLLFDCLAIKEDFDQAEQVAIRFKKSPALMKDPELVSRVDKVLSTVKSKRAEVAERNKLWKKAALVWVEIATENASSPDLDKIWWNAAIDFEKARLVGSAIKALDELIKAKPDSNYAKKAIYRIGRNYQDVARYESAAEKYEAFAAKYAGGTGKEEKEEENDRYAASLKNTATALNTAAFFRRGLGQNDKAIADTQLFVKSYGGRKEFTDQAAGVAFGEAAIYEQNKETDKLRKHLLDYLKGWGQKGGVDRQVVAHVKLGEIAWKASCPVAGVNGACIDVVRPKTGKAAEIEAKAAKKKKKGKKKGADLPPECGRGAKITVHERKPALVKEAQGHFAEALKLWKSSQGGKTIPAQSDAERADRAALMGYYAAEARMMQGDVEYEKFLGLKMPDKLDFTPAPPDASPGKVAAAKKRIEESKKKFKDWIDGKTKQTQLAQKVFQDVILFKQAHWAIAAAARIGQIFQDFSGQLLTAHVPKAPPTPQGLEADEWEQMFHDSYCDQMVDTAEPLEGKAIEGLGTCLGKSTELSWFNEWSQLCEGELNQIKPSEYPLASEIRAEPGYSAATVTEVSVSQTESK